MNEFDQQSIDQNDVHERFEDPSVVQVIQQWKSKTSDHQYSSQALVDQLPSTIHLSNEIPSTHTDKNSNKAELSTIIDESEKSILTMKKRVTPIPASYIRRRPNLKNESSNPKLLVSNHKNKPGGTDTIIKKPTKTTPIFIAPKKPVSQPHTFSSLSLDDSLQITRKAILERQSAIIDEHNSSSMATRNPASPVRFYVHSSGSSVDGNSSDESDHESLLIRKKVSRTKKQQFPLSFPIPVNIPSSIFITDPYGHSHPFDPDNDIREKTNPNEQNSDIDSNANDTNTLFPNSTFEISSAPDITIIPPTPPVILDKHTLHSIGEEEEEEDADEKKQTNLNIPDKNPNRSDKEPLGRRWSDGEEKKQISSPSPLMKMASAASVIKPTENPPVKLSKTKYLLMKLHLTSSNKEDESNTTPPKKHSRSKLFTTNDSNSHLHESSNTLTPDQPIQRVKSITDSIRTANTSSHKKTTKPEIFGSVGNLDVADSDDDIDGTFEKAKLGLQNRASSYMDIRGSQLSINSILSETKARYGLDISGTIELKLTYTQTIGAFDVFINKCTNLARAKRHASDPFVKVYLLPDRSKNSKRKTEIKKNTTDPLFEAKFRYHVTKQEFETRILWISVWSQASLGQNDFLGEIHIPLANCVLDKTEEHQLLAKKNKHDLTPNLQPTMGPGEIQFQLTFTENPKNKDIGALQVQSIEGKAIYYGKNQVEAICKGLLMPDNIKRKLPNMRKGPTPKWEVPLRWDGVRRDNLQNTSVEISIWCQERFRKIMLGFVRLNLAQGYFDNKSVKWLDSTNVEKSAWETFLRDPTEVHHFKLPLRPAMMENK